MIKLFNRNRMSRKSTLAIGGVTRAILACFAAIECAAEERPLSLAECIDLSIKHNLDLESGLKTPLIAAQNLRSARAAYEPSFSVDSNYRSTTSPGGVDTQTSQFFSGTETTWDRYGTGLSGQLPTGMTYSLGASKTRTDVLNNGAFFNENGVVGVDVRQPLLKNLWIDSTRLQIALGRLNLRISESQLRSLLMSLVTNVEFAYYDLVAARDRLRIIQQSYELASQLVESHRKQVNVGRMARLDEKQAQSRVATSEAALFAARNQVTERETALKLLISDDFAAWADKAIIPATAIEQKVTELSRDSSWARALTQRPEVTQARLQLDKENVQLRFARNQRFPSLDLTASYALTGSDQDIRNGDTPDYGVGFVFSIPLGNSVARARHEAQKLRKQQALIAYKGLEQQVMAEVLNAMNAVDSSARRVTATSDARAFAETALEAEEKKLANGKSTNFIVLQLQADLTQARLNETLALVDYNRALATLALREASTLDRHSISLRDRGEATKPKTTKFTVNAPQ
jgi:outer membrane protein